MLRQRQGQHLDTWISNARNSGVAALAWFATGPHKDYEAVRNGLTLHWSSGAVEGNVCRLKAIKRAMFGCANFDLLRRRVLWVCQEIGATRLVVNSLRPGERRPSKVISKALTAGFQRIVQRRRPCPVGSRLITAR